MCDHCEEEFDRIELCHTCEECEECCECQECPDCLEPISRFDRYDDWCRDCDMCRSCCICSECCVDCGEHDILGRAIDGDWYCHYHAKRHEFRCPGCKGDRAFATVMGYTHCPECSCVYRREPNLMGWSLHETGLAYMGPFPNFVTDQELQQWLEEEECQKRISTAIYNAYRKQDSPTEPTQEAPVATTHIFNRQEIIRSLDAARQTIKDDIERTQEYNERQTRDILSQVKQALEEGKFTTASGKEIDVMEISPTERLRVVATNVDREVPVFTGHTGIDQLITRYDLMDGDTVELDHDEYAQIERVLHEKKQVEDHLDSLARLSGEE